MPQKVVKRKKAKPTRRYNFKFLQEVGWGILVAIIVTIAQALVEFDANAIKDWQVWAVGLTSGCARAVAVLVIKSFTQDIVFSKE